MKKKKEEEWNNDYGEFEKNDSLALKRSLEKNGFRPKYITFILGFGDDSKLYIHQKIKYYAQ